MSGKARAGTVTIGGALAVAAMATALYAQQPAAGAAAQGSIYQRFAPIDLTGTWVSVVTEDWQFRMITPAKGDFENLPLNAAAEKVANAWDPARDETAGTACQAYGAPTIMREPGRVRVGWQPGGNALRVEIDSGQQTRLFHFAGATPPAGSAGWQGFSQASWEYAGGFDLATLGTELGPAGRRGRGGRPPVAKPNGGALRVVTTHLRAGYLRKNGVPFSEKAEVTEYFNVYTDVDNTSWLVVTTIVRDPTYLRTDYITSSNFKKEPDDSRWRPRSCTVR
jgi:hypothetical protein